MSLKGLTPLGPLSKPPHPQQLRHHDTLTHHQPQQQDLPTTSHQLYQQQLPATRCQRCRQQQQQRLQLRATRG